MSQWIFLLTSIFLTQPGWGSEVKVMAENSSISLKAPIGSTVWVSDGKVTKVRDLGGSLSVFGKKAGASQIQVGSSSYLIEVLAQDQYQLYETLHSQIAHLKGVRLAIRNSTIHITGTLLRFTDWVKLASAASNIPANFIFSAALEPNIEHDARAYLKQKISEQSLPMPKINFEAPVAAHLSPSLKSSLAAYEKAFKPFGIQILVDESSIAPAPLVRLQVLVAELKKSSKKTLGLSWSGSYEAQLVSNLRSNPPLSVTLNALEEKGLGKVLASPHLLCRSGGEAEFLAGGEFPIRLMGYKTKDVVWKRHGVLLKFEPKADYLGNMSIKITTEISLIDEAMSVDGLPGMKTNRIVSHFDLSGPRTIALSGLIKSQVGKSQSGWPYLQDIPVLGRLFSSPLYQQEKTELVVFITPQVLSPETHEDSKSLPEDWDAL